MDKSKEQEDSSPPAVVTHAEHPNRDTRENEQEDDREKERLALKNLVDYAIQCARESNFKEASDALIRARENLVNSPEYYGPNCSEPAKNPHKRGRPVRRLLIQQTKKAAS